MEESAYHSLYARETTHWYPTTRREIVRAFARSRISDTDLAVLEIGSGTGGNIPLLREFGTLTCIEMNPTARELTRTRVGPNLDLRAGTWPSDTALRAGERFDLIAMLDVLEHLEDDVQGLKAVRDRIAPGGHLLLTVPTYPWMWSAHDTSLHHYRRYTRRSLERALADSGLVVIRASYFNTLLFPAAALARLTFRALRIDRSPGQGLQHAFVNSTFRWIFRREVQPLRSRTFPFGLSLIVLAVPRP